MSLFLRYNKYEPNDQIKCFVINACIFLFSKSIRMASVFCLYIFCLYINPSDLFYCIKVIMGPRGAIHVNHLQVPCGAFLRWDLSWRELVNVTISYVDSKHFLISTCSTCGLQYGSMQELQNNLLGLMVLDLW